LSDQAGAHFIRVVYRSLADKPAAGAEHRM
jgi:hypothetical protein